MHITINRNTLEGVDEGKMVMSSTFYVLVPNSKIHLFDPEGVTLSNGSTKLKKVQAHGGVIL